MGKQGEECKGEITKEYEEIIGNVIKILMMLSWGIYICQNI